MLVHSHSVSGVPSDCDDLVFTNRWETPQGRILETLLTPGSNQARRDKQYPLFTAASTPGTQPFTDGHGDTPPVSSPPFSPQLPRNLV